MNTVQQQFTTRYTFLKKLKAFFPLTGLFAVLILFSVPVFGAQRANVQISAPNTVEVENAVEIQFDIVKPNLNKIGGYEMLVYFDKFAADFGGVYVGDVDGLPEGWKIIVSDDIEQGIAFALYRCEIAGCEEDEESTDSRKAKRDREIHTVTLRLVPVKTGRLFVGLESAQFVDYEGHPLDVKLPNKDLRIKVLDQGLEDNKNWTGKGVKWTLPEPLPENERPISAIEKPAEELDRNLDERLSYLDVAETLYVWEQTRRLNIVCDLGQKPEYIKFDVTNDGCIDVSDIQQMSMHPGSQPSPIESKPNGDEGRSASRAANSGFTFVVNSVADDNDVNLGDGVCQSINGECTLRAAMLEANVHQGPDQIHFDIPGTGPHTIQLNDVLPTLNDETGGLTIDGYTQPGSSVNTDPLASNAVIAIEVKGNGKDDHNAFLITSANNTIKGLAIYDSYHAIHLYNSGARYNTIVGNFIGTDAGATFRAADSWNRGHGIYVDQGANRNTIGTSALEDRNVIGGNSYVGIRVDHGGSDNNIFHNNIIGLTPDGNGNLRNGKMGMDLQWGPSNNVIGGSGFRERNVISGHNTYAGFDFSHSQFTSNNYLVGNFIGTDLTGNQAFSYTGNGLGVIFKDDVFNNYVYDNVISGNFNHALWHKHNYTGRNYIFNNRVGVGADGSTIGNAKWGMLLTGHNWQIGPGNIFAGNASGGIYIDNRLGSGPNEPSDNSDENHIFQNSFYDNGGLAIDILPVGVNLNDAGDVDTGPNQGLNFPEITSASLTNVQGTACANCSVEVYLSDSGSGQHGAGRQYLTTVTADASGNFDAAISNVAAGQYVTAIAIDATENTSEFSLNRQVVDGQSNCTDCVDFTSTVSYSNQDASSNVQLADGGMTIILADNTWRRTTQTFDITADTILEFTFSSTSEGEIHAIGFDADDSISETQYFKLYGTQSSGLTNFETYSGSGEVTYQIPVGQYFTGSNMYMTLVNDQDSGSGANSTYKNVRVYDSSTTPPTPEFPTATPIFTHTPVPSPTNTPTPGATPTPDLSGTIIEDSFDRTDAVGWSNADNGGAYSYFWGGSAINSFSVNGDEGLITIDSAGGSRDAVLLDTAVLNSEAEITFKLDQIPNSNSYIRMLSRQINGNTGYRSSLLINSSGTSFAFVDRLVNGSWASVSSTQATNVQILAGVEYKLKVETSGTNPTEIYLKVWDASQSEPNGWQHVATDTTAALQTAGSIGVRFNLSGGVSNLPAVAKFDDLSVKDLDVGSENTATGRLESVTTSVDGTWSTVSLNQTYDSPVVACSVTYLNNTVPVVIRVRNVSASSFEAKLQNPGDLQPVVADSISCLVVEEGAWTLPDDRKIEAGLVDSSITDGAGSWIGQNVGYQQSYTSPVVFGQVMTYNDPKWSVFWSRGGSVVDPASTTSLYVGKEVGEDPDQSRLTETLGYIVLDAGSGTLDNNDYVTALGSDTAFDFSNPATYTLTPPFASAPSFVLVAQAAMDGGNGGWAYVYGNNAVTSSSITVAIDEDQIADSERAHTSEQVGYAAFANPISLTWGDSAPPTPTPTPEPLPEVVYASDLFNRSLNNTWGVADVGGTYTMLWGNNANNDFSVNGSEGVVTLSPGGSREANLDGIEQQDFDTQLTFKTDNLDVTNQDLMITARKVDAGTLYRFRARITPSGYIQLTQYRAVGGSWSVSEHVTVPGLIYQPGTNLNVRYQVVNSNPTTLRAKLWAEGSSEPTNWHYSVTDSETLLQSTGGFGLKFVNGSGASNTNVFSVDELRVTNVINPPASGSTRNTDVATNWLPTTSQGVTIYMPTSLRGSAINPIVKEYIQDNR